MIENKKDKKGSVNLYRPFLYFLVILAIIGVLYLLQDFLSQIVIAAMLASFTYPLYLRLYTFLAKKEFLSALIMTSVLFAIIVLPLAQLVIYGAQKLPGWVSVGQSVLDNINIIEDHTFNFFKISEDSQTNVRAGVMSILDSSGDIILKTTSSFLTNIGSFFLAIFIFLFSYFYFLLHGREIGRKFMRFSPLAKKYNLELIDSFQNISRSSFWSIGVSAFIQGLLSALSLVLIGWPFILAFIISFALSIVPYFLVFFYVPLALYLLSLGQVWPAIMLLAWNLLLVANIDKLIRAYIAKGKTKVNMVFMLFAILGGIALFGITGVFIGPLIAALAIRVIDIYGDAFSHKLDE